MDLLEERLLAQAAGEVRGPRAAGFGAWGALGRAGPLLAGARRGCWRRPVGGAPLGCCGGGPGGAAGDGRFPTPNERPRAAAAGAPPRMSLWRVAMRTRRRAKPRPSSAPARPPPPSTMARCAGGREQGRPGWGPNEGAAERAWRRACKRHALTPPRAAAAAPPSPAPPLGHLRCQDRRRARVHSRQVRRRGRARRVPVARLLRRRRQPARRAVRAPRRRRRRRRRG
jgi:hypothetical protein